MFITSKLGRPGLAAMLPLFLLVAGCGGDDEDTDTISGTGDLELVHPATLPLTPLEPGEPAELPLTPLINPDYEYDEPASVPPGVDTLSLRFYDERNNPVHGPIRVAASNDIELRAVPLSARYIDIDYLRNGGFALYEDREIIDWRSSRESLEKAARSALVDDPDPGPARPQTTAWSTSVDNGGRARLSVSVNGAEAEAFLVKGMAYAPAPIGYDTRSAGDLGDLFWQTPAKAYAMNAGFPDWTKLWQRDVGTLRELGLNAVRVYNMMPYHLAFNPDGTLVDPDAYANGDPLPNGSPWYVYKHTKFLDALWNNGEQPLYVLIGIPLPNEIWFKPSYDNRQTDPAIAAVIRFWDRVFTAQVEEVADHPAVLGFALFNENNGAANYTPASHAEHFWNQVRQYSERAKALAPDKLVGWAAFDDGGAFIRENMDYLRSHGGAIDFFGVNTYQLSDWEPALSAYRRDNLGDLARPVILTEFGFPATARNDTTQFRPYQEPGLSTCKARIAAAENVSEADITPSGDVNLTLPTLASALSLYETPDTHEAVASVLRRMVSAAFNHPISTGMMYFEWSDEWWKQEPAAAFLIPDRSVPDPNARKTVHCLPFRVDRKEGGNPNSGFPNGYWDEEGFGLHAVELNGRDKNVPFSGDWSVPGGNTHPDKLIRREPMMKALLDGYAGAEQRRAEVLGR